MWTLTGDVTASTNGKDVCVVEPTWLSLAVFFIVSQGWGDPDISCVEPAGTLWQILHCYPKTVQRAIKRDLYREPGSIQDIEICKLEILCLKCKTRQALSSVMYLSVNAETIRGGEYLQLRLKVWALHFHSKTAFSCISRRRSVKRPWD